MNNAAAWMAYANGLMKRALALKGKPEGAQAMTALIGAALEAVQVAQLLAMGKLPSLGDALEDGQKVMKEIGLE